MSGSTSRLLSAERTLCLEMFAGEGGIWVGLSAGQPRERGGQAVEGEGLMLGWQGSTPGEQKSGRIAGRAGDGIGFLVSEQKTLGSLVPHCRAPPPMTLPGGQCDTADVLVMEGKASTCVERVASCLCWELVLFQGKQKRNRKSRTLRHVRE